MDKKLIFAFFTLSSIPAVDLSFDEKVGQLLMVQCAKDTNIEELVQTIKECHCGGVFFLAPQSLKQQIDTTNYLQQQSNLPLLVGQDLEWGLHMRHTDIPKFPYALTLGALSSNNGNLIYKMAKRIAYHARSIGVHITASPVADVNTNPNNPIIGFRSFGTTPEKVIEKTALYIKGLQDGGILACVKHFPGHGSTVTDSHLGTTHINKTWQQLEKDELPPFKAAIKSGVDMVMTGHLIAPALDGQNPATLSREITTNFLRDKLSFRNLIITDALGMGAISKLYTPSDAVIKAFVAGNDIILFPQDVAHSYVALKQFISDHPEYQAQLDNSVARILAAKSKLGIFENRLVKQIDHPEDTILTAEDLQLIKTLYQRAITLVHGTIDVTGPAIVVHLGNPDEMKPFDATYMQGPTSYNFEQAMELASTHRAIITFPTSARGNYPPQWLEQLRQLTAKFNSTIVLFGSPTVIHELPKDTTLVIAYEATSNAQIAAAEILSGAVEPCGILPD